MRFFEVLCGNVGQTASLSYANWQFREFQENNYPTQRRKGAKFKTLLCVFAPLRENLLGQFKLAL